MRLLLNLFICLLEKVFVLALALFLIQFFQSLKYLEACELFEVS